MQHSNRRALTIEKNLRTCAHRLRIFVGNGDENGADSRGAFERACERASESAAEEERSGRLSEVCLRRTKRLLLYLRIGAVSEEV